MGAAEHGLSASVTVEPCRPIPSRPDLPGAAHDATGGVRIAITDNGTGICPDQLDRIFEPFVSTKQNGVGLGLAVCRSIVTSHEGRLWAENNTDAGATFYLWLPQPAP